MGEIPKNRKEKKKNTFTVQLVDSGAIISDLVLVCIHCVPFNADTGSMYLGLFWLYIRPLLAINADTGPIYCNTVCEICIHVLYACK